MRSILLLLFSSLLFACKKKDRPSDAVDAGVNCVKEKASAETITVFPADNAWNEDISTAPVDPYNAEIIAGFSTNSIKADFGSGTWDNAPIGIPYIVVCSTQTKMPVVFTDYGNESDPGPYPIPLDAPVEGNGVGDAHVIAVDGDNGLLYELYHARVNGGRWEAASGAIFNLRSNALRPEGWTSADAAGLPIFPGLVRFEETERGEIDHAIRFTLASSKVRPAYIHPARHKVNSTGGPFSLPFGAKIRLKAGYDISGFSARNQVILRAMKKYGLILADIGSNLYFSGAPDERWNNNDLKQLGQLKGADFEVIRFNQ
ncbi:MAG TPA: hypothetical protein VFR58_11265 [Flavisolibacter sp.]|nr:hypothetical protein [Flavisolibacter sp.]